MIPQAYITEWSSQAPWADEVQVEQDMVLNRLLIEIAHQSLLGEALAFRGGTCLQKLHLPAPLRYSEDLDYVRTDDDPKLGDVFDALRKIATEIGLREHRRKFPGERSDMGAIWFDADPEIGPGRIRVKIESNVAETHPLDGYVQLPFEMASRWWSGRAEVRTFKLEELLGTKLRALYQRRKGRDLFDLWAALTQLEVDDRRVVESLDHYEEQQGRRTFTYPQLRINLEGKVADRTFLDDLNALIAVPPDAYEVDEAAALVLARLGAFLRNDPSS